MSEIKEVPVPVETKYSHFHGMSGQLIGAISYKVDHDEGYAVYKITRVSPKCKRPTRKEGRDYADSSTKSATVSKEFLMQAITKKSNVLDMNEVDKFMINSVKDISLLNTMFNGRLMDTYFPTSIPKDHPCYSPWGERTSLCQGTGGTWDGPVWPHDQFIAREFLS